MKKLVLLVLFLCISCALFSQEPVSIHLTQKDGLPDIEFYDMIEDHEGFIWLAADKGLFRYNGKEYKSYSHPKKRGLSVFNLLLDKKGRVWCNNVSGQFFYVENDSLKLFADIKDTLSTIKLATFSIDDKDNIYIATDQGLSFLDKNIGKLEVLLDRGHKLDLYHEVKNDKNQIYFVLDSLYVFRDKKLMSSHPLDHSYLYKRIFNFNNKYYQIESKIKKTNPTIDNNTIFSVIDDNTGKSIRIPTPKKLKNKTIIQINEIDGRIWVNTNEGIYVYKIKNDVFFYENSFFGESFTTKTIKDLNGNYWITTIKDGAYIIPNLYVGKLDTQENIKDVTAIEIINDQLIYGVEIGQIGLKNLKTGEESSIKIKDKLKVHDFAYNQNTNTLLIDSETGSYFWDINSGDIFNVHFFRGTKDIHTVNKNSIIVSYFSGAQLIDLSNYEITFKKNIKLEDFRLTNKTIEPKKITALSNIRGYANHYKKDSTIYIGQVDKLYFFDKNLSKTEVKYKGNSIFTSSITETEDGIVWVATNNNGILGIKEQKVIYNYSIEPELTSNLVLKVIGDGNNFWAVTNRGLHFFDRELELFKSFSFQNEIPIQKVNDIKLHKNKLYLAGNSGIFVVDKSHFSQKIEAPVVYFESISVGNSLKEENESYQISYNKSSFEVHFNANVFNSKESISYLYRLKGLEENWTRTIANNVKYSSLPSGLYTFEIKVLTNKGVESKEIKTIQLRVTKPFWYHWWFYLLLLLLIFIYYRVSLIRIHKKQEEKIEKEIISKELVLSQLENLRSQMNPHFIFNVLNSIQEYIITNDKYTASLYLAEFSKLIRLYLDHSRQEVIRLSEELKALKIYLDLEKNRFEDDFKYTITIDKNVNIENTQIPSLFIQPYIENSIKHGLLHKSGSKVLLVDFKYDAIDQILICHVVDNGVGRKVSQEINKRKEEYHVPFATEANSNRVDLLNKNRKRKISIKTIDLYNDKLEPKGTKITIQIPL